MTSPLVIKVCGVTIPSQVAEIVEAGATWIGLNFWPQSSRYLSPSAAIEVAKSIPSHVIKVGVFVDAAPSTIQQRIQDCGLHRVQFHGGEPREALEKYSVPGFKAIKAETIDDLESVTRFVSRTSPLFLLDAKHPTLPGGTGLRVEASVAIRAATMGQCLLAGGLHPGNVEEVVRQARPYGVDVASGVESQPGIKCIASVQAFVKAAHQGFQTEDLRR